MNIKMLIMDVDGTLTDGKIYMGENGEVCKVFNIKDGYAIHNLLIPTGIIPVVITGRSSKIVENRCIELGISEIYQGISDKGKILIEVAEKWHIPINKIAYIGDDLNDLNCMQIIKKRGGYIGCPSDAVDTVKKIADFVSHVNGGNGAVREFIEWLLVHGKF